MLSWSAPTRSCHVHYMLVLEFKCWLIFLFIDCIPQFLLIFVVRVAFLEVFNLIAVSKCISELISKHKFSLKQMAMFCTALLHFRAVVFDLWRSCLRAGHAGSHRSTALEATWRRGPNIFCCTLYFRGNIY